MTSLQFQAVLQLLKTNPNPTGLTVVEQREAREALAAQTPLPPNVYAERVTAVSVPALLLAPENASDDRVVLYLHGGGYALNSSNTHKDLAWRLGAACQARVLVPDYRLAPEHPFPAAVEDALTTYRWLLAQGILPENVVLVGDSAGGGLVMAAAVSLRDAGDPLPAALVCISPWSDLTLSGQSIDTHEEQDPILSRERLQWFVDLYLPDGQDPRQPLASPLFADLSGLPPTLIQVGTAEVLLDDAKMLAAAAEQAGVAVTLKIWDEMFHVWHSMAAVVPESQQAVDEIGAFVSGQLGN